MTNNICSTSWCFLIVASCLVLSPVQALNLELQTQIYIISGVFGGVIIVIGILMMVMSLLLARLSSSVKPSDRYMAGPETPNTFDNAGFVNNAHDIPPVQRSAGDDELKDMGYEIYSPRRDNRSRDVAQPAELQRVISVQSDMFRGGDERFYSNQPQPRYGNQYS